MFSFEMLCKQLVSRVSSGDQTLENNKTLALRARVSYRFLVFGSPDETLKLVVYIYNKKTFDTLNLQFCLPIVASLTALSYAKQVRIWVQTERSSMLIQLTYILYKYGWFKMFSIEFSKLLSIDMIRSNCENAGFC